MPALKVAYIADRGSYETLPTRMIELANWFGKQATGVGGQPGATYHDSPDNPGEDELRWEVWIPTTSAAREHESVDGRIGVKTLPAGTCAALIHVGPYEGLDRSIAALKRWAAEHGHLPDGPLQTVFVDDPGDVDEDDLKTLIRFPVKA